MTLRFMTAGESHGPALLAILDGLPAGLLLSAEAFRQDLRRRQTGTGAGPRMKLEQDEAVILGGVMAGLTTGAPLALMIQNRDHDKWRGKAIEPMTTPRPGHADLTGAIKYGYRDLRPSLERASARETAARVAVGAACRALLAQFGITVGGYVLSIGDVAADPGDMPYAERIARAAESVVGCPTEAGTQAMHEHIQQAMQARNTLGGVIEAVVLGLPPGLGSFVQWDRRLDSRLAAAILSIQAFKGCEIGAAFDNARLPGTQAQDPILLEQGCLVRPSERSGGLEGGVTTGQPLVLRGAMKPIATTLTPQPTVDLATGETSPTRYERSDFCPVPRAVVIVEAMIAFVIADALIEKLGGDSLAEMLPRFEMLKRTCLEDLPMDGVPHIFWPLDSTEPES